MPPDLFWWVLGAVLVGEHLFLLELLALDWWRRRGKKQEPAPQPEVGEIIHMEELADIVKWGK